nr:hypothetical protein Itr_chr14CG19850 [Ipomoea trifida]
MKMQNNSNNREFVYRYGFEMKKWMDRSSELRKWFCLAPCMPSKNRDVKIVDTHPRWHQRSQADPTHNSTPFQKG